MWYLEGIRLGCSGDACVTPKWCSRIFVILTQHWLPRHQLIFPSKTWFFGIYLNFQWQKSLKNQHLPRSKSKSYQIKIFPTTPKKHIPIPRIFQLWFHFTLTFSEEIIQYSKTFALEVQTAWNQANAPLLLESFPKRPITWSEASWLGGSHKYKTNKLPSFIDTSVACGVGPSVTTSSTDFSFQNAVFWNLFEFSAAEIT